MTSMKWSQTVMHTVFDHYDNEFGKALPLVRNTLLPRATATGRVLLGDEKNKDPEYVRAVIECVMSITGVEDRVLIERLVLGEDLVVEP